MLIMIIHFLVSANITDMASRITNAQVNTLYTRNKIQSIASRKCCCVIFGLRDFAEETDPQIILGHYCS